jgi:hypothetical protein
MAKLMAAEWVHFEPTLKDRIIGKAQEGRWHKDWAERVAKKYKIGPLAKRPETAMFDPMAEAVWTLAMVVAWIVWRTPDDVRENWNAYRIGCLDWRCHPRRVSRDGGRTWEQVGIYWDLKTRRAASLVDLRIMTVEQETRRLMTVDDAWNALRNRAAAGEVTVAAIRHDAGRPVQIPAHEWAYLEWMQEHLLGDELRFGVTSQPQYSDITLSKEKVCKLWPPATARKQTIVGERGCQSWLEDEMRQSPECRPKSKREYKIEGQNRFKVAERAFERAWSKAIIATGTVTWSASGRPSKKLSH